MRASSWLVLGFLAGCDGTQGQGVAAPNGNAAGADDRIECALAGAERFAADCVVETAGATLTIRHPDGGFRRLLVTKDGRGVVAADGAAPATVQVLGEGRIEVTLEGDRYRLPATVAGR